MGSNNSKLGVLLILGLLIGGSAGYFGNQIIVNPQIFELEAQVRNLETQLSEANLTLSHTINEYEEELEDLQEELEDLQEELEDVEDELSDTQRDYRQAQIEISGLESQKNQLESEIATLTQINELHVGNGLDSFYEKVRDLYTPTSARTQKLINKQQCQFSAKLALHDLSELTWSNLENEYSEYVGGDSCDDAYDILFKAYTYCDIGYYDSDATKVEKILEFVNVFIEYEYEIDDPTHAPVETLSLRSGDCDDFTVLTAALFELAGIESAIGLFENDEDVAHNMVLIHLDDLGKYGCWYYEDLTKFDLLEGKWIKIEPQGTIDRQDEDWMSQWDLMMAVEIDYDKVT